MFLVSFAVLSRSSTERSSSSQAGSARMYGFVRHPLYTPSPLHQCFILFFSFSFFLPFSLLCGSSPRMTNGILSCLASAKRWFRVVRWRVGGSRLSGSLRRRSHPLSLPVTHLLMNVPPPRSPFSFLAPPSNIQQESVAELRDT